MKRIALIAVVVLGLLPSVASARATVSVQPKVVSWAGGTVILTIKVPDPRHAQCETLYAPGPEHFARCHHYTLRVVEPNIFHIPQVWHAQLLVRGGKRVERLRFVLKQTARPTPPPALNEVVRRLDECSPGPECDYGPIRNKYPAYDNFGPLGDCDFAAAADWEQVMLGTVPNEPLILSMYASVGALPATELFSYWQSAGVNGVYLDSVEALPLDKTALEESVRAAKALIVDFDFTGEEYFGIERRTTDGLHLAVVDGFTPVGPLVVTYGETIQMTWGQWEEEADGLWLATAR